MVKKKIQLSRDSTHSYPTKKQGKKVTSEVFELPVFGLFLGQDYYNRQGAIRGTLAKEALNNCSSLWPISVGTENVQMMLIPKLT